LVELNEIKHLKFFAHRRCGTNADSLLPEAMISKMFCGFFCQQKQMRLNKSQR
jgi:hypothetical protein